MSDSKKPVVDTKRGLGKFERILLPPIVTIPKYLWENALKPFFEK
jgi:hypothetical protein